MTHATLRSVALALATLTSATSGLACEARYDNGPSSPGERSALIRDADSIARDGDRMALGFAGRHVILIEKNRDGAWIETDRVQPPRSSDDFGAAVALAGDRLIVGSPGDDLNATDAGAVFTFVKNGPRYVASAELHASGATGGELFGCSLALDGAELLVGSTGAGPGLNTGAAYLFERNGNDWTKTATLTAKAAKGGDYFGWSVALRDDLAIVGAPFSEGPVSGSAHVFRRGAGTWTEEARISEGNDYFGQTVATDGRNVQVEALSASADLTPTLMQFISNGEGSWSQDSHLPATSRATMMSFAMLR